MSKKKFDVVALGELLVDFTENGVSPQGNPILEANPGGAPCNVLAMLNKLGKKTAFIGKVGNDLFGHMLIQVASDAGICIDELVIDDHYRTTLAFVKTLEGGDRDFSFYRNPGADMMLQEDEISEEMLHNTAVFHFGTLSMTHEGVRRATKKALDIAAEAGALISFDPNLREPLWDSLENAKKQIEYGLSRCHILKISDNEAEFMTGTADFDEAAAILRSKYPNIQLLNLTAGAKGSYAYYKDQKVFVPGFCLGGTIETTGAGDTFCACALYFVLEHGIDQLSGDQLKEMLTFANAAAYIVTTRKGAIKSMPEKRDVETLIN